MTPTARAVVAALLVTLSLVASPALAAASTTAPAADTPRELASGGTGGAVAATDGTVSAGGCSYPLTRTDATGTNVTIREPPERVVTLGPSAAQTMWEIGAKDKVVGLTDSAAYLDGAENRTLVATGFTVSTETIVNLTPDLVLVPNIRAGDTETIRKLRDANLTVFVFDRATSIEFVYRKTRLTGRLVGACDAADARVGEMRDQVETIREATRNVEDKRVFHLLGSFTAGRNTFIDEIITVAGGENIGARYGSGYYIYSSEKVIAANPEWITRTYPAPFPEGFGATTAVTENQTVMLNANYASQPAPRIVLAMVQLVKALHPDAYRQARLGDVKKRFQNDRVSPYRFADPVSATMDGDTAVLRVKKGEPPTSRFTLPEEFARNESARPTHLNVSSREPSPIFTVRVRPTTNESPPLPGNDTLLAAYGVTTEDLFDRATGAGYTVQVPLEETGGNASRVTIYQRTTEGWQPLQTRVTVNETDQTARATAEADVLTAFAIGLDRPERAGDAPADSNGTPQYVSTPAPTGATPTPTPTATPTPRPTTSATTATPATGTSGQGPGLGIPAAVAALAFVGAAGALRRRR